MIGLGGPSGGSSKKTMLIDVGFDVNATLVDQSMVNAPNVDTSYLSGANKMFAGAIELVKVPKIDTSRVTNMSYMFDNCTSLEEVPELDTSSLTNAAYMFRYCTKLTKNPPVHCPNVLRGNGMFQSCSSLKSVTNLDAEFSECDAIFSYCSALETVEFLDISSVSATVTPAQNATKLVTCNVFGLKTTIYFETNSALSKESALYLFEHAKKVSSSKKIKFHANTFNQLTADEIAIATQKNYSVIC